MKRKSLIFFLGIVGIIGFGLFPQTVRADSVTYSYNVVKSSRTIGRSYLTSTDMSDYLYTSHKSWAVMGNSLISKSASGDNIGDGYITVTTTFSTGYNITQIDGTFKYAGTTKYISRVYN